MLGSHWPFQEPFAGSEQGPKCKLAGRKDGHAPEKEDGGCVFCQWTLVALVWPRSLFIVLLWAAGMFVVLQFWDCLT